MRIYSICYFVLILLLSACDKPNGITVNQITSNSQGNLVVVGTKTGISKTPYIQSPFIYTFDSDLTQLDSKTIETNTTALNPQLTPVSKTNSILSFYKAEALDIATEKSHIISLDENLNTLASTNYGHRSRIEALSASAGKLYALNYERADRNSSISMLKDLKLTQQLKVSEGQETTIPTDLIVDNNEALIMSSIANGFHYKDGHSYESKKAYGHLAVLTMKDSILYDRKLIGSQHLFINDLELIDGGLIVTGTVQQEGTGMDILLVTLDDTLGVKKEIKINAPGTQEGIKTLSYDNGYLTLASVENTENEKMQIKLIAHNYEGAMQWEKTITESSNYEAKDFLILKDKIYIIANKYDNKIESSQAELISVSLKGEVIQSKSFE